MSDPVGPGDWVECVDVTPHPGFILEGLTLGALYRVRGVLENPTFGSLLVIDAPILNEWGGYLARRFRPIYRPKAELIESLKVAARSVAPQVVRERSRETIKSGASQ